VVGVTRDKHALSFGAGRACPNGLNKAHSLGRPPERPEVGKAARSASLLLLDWRLAFATWPFPYWVTTFCSGYA